MIITYGDVKSGIQNRADQKTLDSIFLKSIDYGAKCPPFISNAILEEAKNVYNLGNTMSDKDSIKTVSPEGFNGEVYINRSIVSYVYPSLSNIVNLLLNDLSG